MKQNFCSLPFQIGTSVSAHHDLISSTGRAAMDNPLGGIKRGWSEIDNPEMLSVYEEVVLGKRPIA